MTDTNKWTQFTDMHSGGFPKIGIYTEIFIEAPQEEAISIFRDRFNQDPYDVACTCCGSNFSIATADSLEQVTGFARNCAYDNKQNKWIEEPGNNYFDRDKVTPLSEYIERENVLIIKKEDIL